MMSIHKRENEAHHHDPTLEALQEHMGDQVMDGEDGFSVEAQ